MPTANVYQHARSAAWSFLSISVYHLDTFSNFGITALERSEIGQVLPDWLCRTVCPGLSIRVPLAVGSTTKGTSRETSHISVFIFAGQVGYLVVQILRQICIDLSRFGENWKDGVLTRPEPLNYPEPYTTPSTQP